MTFKKSKKVECQFSNDDLVFLVLVVATLTLFIGGFLFVFENRPLTSILSWGGCAVLLCINEFVS